MPDNETITSFAARIIEVAGLVIAENGGRKISHNGKTFYRIRVQKPANVERLSSPHKRLNTLLSKLKPQIKAGLDRDATTRQRARAAYLAICLDLTDSLRSEDTERLEQAMAALEKYPKLLDVIFNKSPGDAGDKLRTAATDAGLKKPKR